LGEQAGTGGILYGDYVCPLSYLAESMVDSVERAGGVLLERRAYELRPAPAPLPAGAEEAGFWTDIVEPYARSLQVGIVRPLRAARSAKAHEAALHAAGHGRFRDFHGAVYQAYFLEGRDIGRIDVLVEIGAKIGLDRTALKVALDIDQHTEAVAASRAEALARGITGAPAFLREDAEPRLLVGLPAPDELRDWLLQGRTHD
jgi:predicted DsbA family dithiol-disulfide isomerase